MNATTATPVRISRRRIAGTTATVTEPNHDERSIYAEDGTYLGTVVRIRGQYVTMAGRELPTLTKVADHLTAQAVRRGKL